MERKNGIRADSNLNINFAVPLVLVRFDAAAVPLRLFVVAEAAPDGDCVQVGGQGVLRGTGEEGDGPTGGRQIRSSPSGLNAPIAVWLAPWSQQEAVSESEAAWQTHPEPEGKQEQEVALAAEEVALTAKEVALTAKEVTAQVRPSPFVDPSPSWSGDQSIAIPADIERQIADPEKEQQEIFLSSAILFPSRSSAFVFSSFFCEEASPKQE